VAEGAPDVSIAQPQAAGTPAGEALGMLDLGRASPEEALREVSTHPQISYVSVVKLPPVGQLPPWFG
jgi:D-3-phosphoglycerate dehydrogenase